MRILSKNVRRISNFFNSIIPTFVLMREEKNTVMQLDKRLVYGVFGLILFMLLVNNGLSLWDQDEAAYAGFGKRMLEQGDWLIPDFPWSDVHRKTPFHFWNISLSYTLFGISEFTMRLSSVAYTFGTMLLIFFALRQYIGERIALTASVVLAASFLVPSLAKVAVTDATLLFFSTLCAISIVKVIIDFKWKWVLIFWLSFAIALLTKGPPIIIFTGGMAGLVLILSPKRWNLLHFHPWFGIPLACLPLYLWGRATVDVDGGVFISWMYDWYVLKRISGSVFGQTGPPGTHLLGMILFFLPFTLFIPKVFKDLLHRFKERTGVYFLITIWFIAGWLIYEFSASKLPAYVIVAHVPFSILIAKALVDLDLSKQLSSIRWRNMLTVFVFFIFIAISVFPFMVSWAASLRTALLIICPLFLGFHIYNLWNKRGFKVSWFLGAWLMFQVVSWTFVYPIVDDYKNTTKELAEDLCSILKSETRVYVANPQGRPPSLFFYLESCFETVEEEFRLGTLQDAYESDEPAVLILKDHQLENFELKYGQLEYLIYEASLSDRKHPTLYYIIYNYSAKL